MSEHLSTILERATARLEDGESLEEILADYPSRRDELAPLLEAARQVVSLRTRSPSTEPTSGLTSFLEEAEGVRPDVAVRQDVKRWFRERLAAIRDLWWYPWTRFAVGVLAAVLLLVSLMISTVSLAADSLPGNQLYPIKLIGEEVHLAFTSDTSARTEHHLRRVRNRAQEIYRLVRAERPVPDVTLARLNQSLEASLLAAASADLPEMSRLLTAVEQTADEQAVLLATVADIPISDDLRQLLSRARLSLEIARAVAHVGQSDLHAFSLNSLLGSFGLEWPSAIPPEPPQPTDTPNPKGSLGE